MIKDYFKILFSVLGMLAIVLLVGAGIYFLIATLGMLWGCIIGYGLVILAMPFIVMSA